MNDIECPYCEADLEINHDDGVGYSQDEVHQQRCSNCEKYFTYTTSISFSYDAQKADCLNDGKHNFELSHTIPRKYSQMICSTCDEKRQPTKEERERYKLDIE